MKTCTKCNVEYPATTEYFGIDKRCKNGITSWCRTCINIKSTAWRKSNPEKHKKYTDNWRKANPDMIKEYSLKKLGFTQELFDQMLEAQGNVCVLCGTDEPGGKGWQADHSHINQKARGVLCMSCNVTLGHIEAKPVDWIDKAKKYINEDGFFTGNSQ